MRLQTVRGTQVFAWDVSHASGLAEFSVVITRDIGSGPVVIYQATDIALSVGTFNFDDYHAATYNITISARAAESDGLTATLTQTVTVAPDGSDPPGVGDGDRFIMFEGELYRGWIEGGTGLEEIPGLTASGLPPGATFEVIYQQIGYALGELIWTPTNIQAGTWDVIITLSDSQGSDELRIEFVILDVPAPSSTPTDLALTPAEINENDIALLNGTFSNPDSSATHTVTIDWADGSTATVLNLPAGVQAFTAPHRYLDDDPTATPVDVNTVSVTVTAASGESVGGATTVTVHNVAPGASQVDAYWTEEAQGNVYLAANIIDPGTRDTFTLTVDWGDGSPLQTFAYPAGTTAFREYHEYTDYLQRV